MILHNSPADFKDLIEATAQHFNLRPVFIEKDYWVCYVLKNLSKSVYAETVVFKGGTSLSKAYSCIQRFSEDIDLAIVSPANYSGNELKKLLKNITEAITGGLTLIKGHALENKFGRIRATVYEYEKILADTDFGVVKDHILVEINCFADPVPHHVKPIQTYICLFLTESANQTLIEEFELQHFNLQVLSLERTYFEKVLALNRLSYNGIPALQEKVRHFYDIHQLHTETELMGRILSPEFFPVLVNVRKDDETNSTMDGKWKGQLISASPLFANLEETWTKIEDSYENGLADLIWSPEKPKPDSILRVLNEIKEYVRLFDSKIAPI